MEKLKTSKNSSHHHSRLFEEFIRKSWWVILFFLICFFAYDHAMKRRLKEEASLRKKLIDIQVQKNLALDKQQDLQLQIASQQDPAWIELTLMKGLGLVPEGQKKILFLQEPLPEKPLSHNTNVHPASEKELELSSK